VLITIIIDNYNYARFLPEAVNSALDQSYPATEIVVVDDGSSDNSKDIIASYGKRITPVFKENGGQGSAFNAGFAVSHGELICFLDADDLFLPEKVAQVVTAWKENPRSALIYHQLQIVDAGKRKLGNPWPRAVYRRDIRIEVEESGGWWPHPTTSGLCCSRKYLEQIFPIPEEAYRLCADAYLAGLAPFVGPVAGIRRPLALYRIHGGNYYNPRAVRDREQVRRKLDRLTLEFAILRQTLHDKLGISSSLSLEDNFRYHQYRWGAGEPVSKWDVTVAAMKTPALPLSMKLRELGKILLNRW
jgi:glycosyltransferase involved in cell wall biosynthesis